MILFLTKFTYLGELIEVYDGIMLPPDENNKKSSFWSSILEYLSKNIIKRFYNDNMLDSYLETTIDAMLYEVKDMSITDLRLTNTEHAAKYFLSLHKGINDCFTNNGRNHFQVKKVKKTLQQLRDIQLFLI